ncbi:hypothetical protein HanPI659440_Chr03g0103961 [Helianthus annuus]|nr:hypothetical protein HanPI659440_Chr03g0103961 [Helianthus annuus]
MANPVAFGQPEPSQTIDDLSGILPVNEERAIVLYDPVNNAPLLQTRSPFTISVNSDFLSGFKSKFITPYLTLGLKKAQSGKRLSALRPCASGSNLVKIQMWKNKLLDESRKTDQTSRTQMTFYSMKKL